MTTGISLLEALENERKDVERLTIELEMTKRELAVLKATPQLRPPAWKAGLRQAAGTVALFAVLVAVLLTLARVFGISP
jgi:hypothetical protein